MTHETLDAAAEVLPAEAIDAIERAATSAHRHEDLFSERAANIKQSAVRDVFDISMRPGLVSLAGGSPYLQSLPLERLGQTVAKIVAEQGMTALQYGGGQGTEELRTQICEVMAAEGILDAKPENVVITAGSQSAQDVATKVFCNPGDVVLVEDPTYVGALNTFEAYQVQVATVPMDGDGIVPELLEARIAALQTAGKNVKFLYTIPSFNNPSGITLSAERRQQVVDICRNANILVLEDNPYGLLRFDGQPLTPLRAANPDDVIYMGSFSKIFAPGLRIGWALVPAHLQRRYYLASEAVTLCPPTLNQMLVSAYLRDYDWRGQIETYRGLYKERCDAMLAALDEYMPAGLSWTRPEGGFFVWVTLPEGVDTYPLLKKAIDAGVVFIPGAAFTHSDDPSNKIRLAFSAVPPESIREGVRRLAPVLREAIAALEPESLVYGQPFVDPKEQFMTGIIVVGVDGSETALKAAHTARDLATSLGATLHVVSAFDSDRTEVYGSGSDKWIVSDAGDAEKVARSVADSLRTPALHVTYAAARGKPAEALIDEAARSGAQLIVVGNRRMQGLGRVLGSVANSVAHNAPCDVYIAKTDASS